MTTDWLCVRKDGKELYYPLAPDGKLLVVKEGAKPLEKKREEMWEKAERIWEAPSVEEIGRAVLVYRKRRAG